jgi:hypothetical protein
MDNEITIDGSAKGQKKYFFSKFIYNSQNGNPAFGGLF